MCFPSRFLEKIFLGFFVLEDNETYLWSFTSPQSSFLYGQLMAFVMCVLDYWKNKSA